MKKQTEDWIQLADKDLYARELKTLIMKDL